MKPFFSVIIPVYNVALYLRECLDSVLAQTFTDWEAICVDDGSTDESGAILDEYAAKDKRFKVFHQANAGVSAARNKALDVSNGEYVCFLDSDDFVAINWLEVFYHVIKDDHCDVIRTSFSYYNNGSVQNRISMWSKIKRTSPQCVAMWGITMAFKDGYSVLNCVKKAKIIGVKYPEGVHLHEDIIFSAMLFSKVSSATEIDYNGYYYRTRQGAAVQTINDNCVKDCYNVFRAMNEFWDEFKSMKRSYEELSLVRRCISKFVFYRTLITAHHAFKVGIRKSWLLRDDFKNIANCLNEMLCRGVLDLRVFKFFDFWAFWLFIKTSSWCCMLLRWKVSAFLDKLSRIIKRSNEGFSIIVM